MNDERYDEDTQYQRPAEDGMYPVASQEQLGQDILRTFARISDPDMIEFKKIKKKVPVLKKKIVKDENGEERELEYSEWEYQEWEIPIKIQPKFHEIITDDISRAFLPVDDYNIYLDVVGYCLTVKSFSKRYDLEGLALHYNNMVDELNAMVAASGSVKGQRVTLAKANIANTTYRAETTQAIEQRMGSQKKRQGPLGLW